MRVLSTLLFALALHESQALLESSICGSRKAKPIRQAAGDTMDVATRQLLDAKDSPFIGYVDGVARLGIDNNTGHFLGGFSNPDGIYFEYEFDDAVLPKSACEKLTKGPQQFGRKDLCGPAGPLGLLNVTNNFFLGQADAIVFHGCTPPPVHYFSWDFYINARIEPDDVFYPGTNFGDTLNVRDVNVPNRTTPPTTDTFDPNLFDQPVVVIHSADGGATNVLEGAFMEAGVDPASITSHPLDSSTLRLWNRSHTWEESRPDLLFLLQRVTEPYDGYQAAFDKFQTLSFPVRYFIAKPEVDASEPFVPTMKSRETDEIDDDVRSGLPTEVELFTEPLDVLMNEVVTKYYDEGGRYMGVNRASLTRYGYYDDWDRVLARRSNDTYIVPTRDCGYSSPQSINPFTKIDNQSVVVALGVIHTSNKTRNQAGFSSVGLDVKTWETCNTTSCYHRQVKYSVWLTHEEARGSAARFLPDDYEFSDDLFAIEFKAPRQCDLKYKALGWCLEFDEMLYINPHGLYPVVAERIYSIAATHVGASEHEAVLIRGLTFSVPAEDEG